MSDQKKQGGGKESARETDNDWPAVGGKPGDGGVCDQSQVNKVLKERGNDQLFQMLSTDDLR